MEDSGAWEIDRKLCEEINPSTSEGIGCIPRHIPVLRILLFLEVSKLLELSEGEGSYKSEDESKEAQVS